MATAVVKKAKLLSAQREPDSVPCFRETALPAEWDNWLRDWPSLKQSIESIIFLTQPDQHGGSVYAAQPNRAPKLTNQQNKF